MDKKTCAILFSIFGFIPLLAIGFILRPAPAVEAEGRPTPGCYNIFLPGIVGLTGPPLASAGTSPQKTVGQGGGPGPQGLCQEAFPDFNGDGYADLAIGVMNEDIEQGPTYEDAGAVHVIYGTAFGLEAFAAQATVDDQLWTRTTDGLDDIAIASHDNFGSALAMGDFNHDGYDDLAIGVSGSFVDGQDDAGAVHVLYGTDDGLAVDGAQLWTQDSAGINGQANEDDAYGHALAAGDFNGDDIDDLAVGIYNETVNGVQRAGAVNIIYGSHIGLNATQIGVGGHPDELLTEESFPFFGSAQFNDHFGTSLVAADFDSDGHTDLAVGIPYEDFAGGLDNAGAVQIYHGSSDGLVDPAVSALSPKLISANTPGVNNNQEANELFGLTLAAGDFDGNGYTDLAIGTPYETHGGGASTIELAGAVNIVYSGQFGLDAAAGAPIFHQGITGMDGHPEAFEFFALSITAADFDRDGFADLAAGTPFDQYADVTIGAVHIIYGSAAGISITGNELIIDGSNPDGSDQFGRMVYALDTDGDSFIELAVGAPGDDPLGLGVGNVGSVFVYNSDADGVDQFNNKELLSGQPWPGW